MGAALRPRAAPCLRPRGMYIYSVLAAQSDPRIAGLRPCGLGGVCWREHERGLRELRSRQVQAVGQGAKDYSLVPSTSSMLLILARGMSSHVSPSSRIHKGSAPLPEQK